jgi:hypothetical protein
VQDAAQNLKEAEAFQLEMRQGENRSLISDALGFPIFFERASAIFVRPNRIAADVTVKIDSLVQDFALVIIGQEQYANNRALTQGRWAKLNFAPGFSGDDIQDDTKGIDVALRNIQNLEMVGRSDIDGVAVYHVKGVVEALLVKSVTVGLMGTSEGVLPVELYVRVRDHYPARLVLVEGELDSSDLILWTIDFQGYNRDDLEVNLPEVDPTIETDLDLGGADNEETPNAEITETPAS